MSFTDLAKFVTNTQSGQITTEKAGLNRPDGQPKVQWAQREVRRDSLRVSVKRELQRGALEVPREVQEVPREEVLDLVSSAPGFHLPDRLPVFSFMPNDYR